MWVVKKFLHEFIVKGEAVVEETISSRGQDMQSADIRSKLIQGVVMVPGHDDDLNISTGLEQNRRTYLSTAQLKLVDFNFQKLQQRFAWKYKIRTMERPRVRETVDPPRTSGC